MDLNYKQAKENFLALNLNECKMFFADNGYLLELAYCELIQDNLQHAKELFEKIKYQDIRAHWGLFLVSMIAIDKC